MKNQTPTFNIDFKIEYTKVSEKTITVMVDKNEPTITITDTKPKRKRKK